MYLNRDRLAPAPVPAYHLPMGLRSFVTVPRPRAAYATAVLSLAAAGLMLWSRHGGPREFAMAFTAVASASFVITALLGGALGSRYGRLMAAGLVFCMLGDLLGPGDFMLGLYAFLIAHFGVTGAFIAKGVDRRNLVVSAVASTIASLCVYFLWLGPHVPPGEQAQIVGYTVVITVMLVFAGATPRFRGRRTALAGAVLFYLSDVFLANWRYVDTGRWNAFVCYPLYYTACVLLALSVLATRRNVDADAMATESAA